MGNTNHAKLSFVRLVRAALDDRILDH